MGRYRSQMVAYCSKQEHRVYRPLALFHFSHVDKPMGGIAALLCDSGLLAVRGEKTPHVFIRGARLFVISSSLTFLSAFNLIGCYPTGGVQQQAVHGGGFYSTRPASAIYHG